MRQSGESSVEEILESIKKVIARDNRDGAAEERRMRERTGVMPSEPAEDEPEDVLDLSEGVELEDSEPDMVEAPLVTEEARISMRDSLAG